MADIFDFPISGGPQSFGAVSEKVIARLIRHNGLVRLTVLIDIGTAERLEEASLWAGKSPGQFVTDMLRAAFPT